MSFSGFNWSLLTVIGPLLLIAAIAWAVLRNRTSKQSMDMTEQATRDLYKEEDRAHKGDGDGGY